MWAGLHFRGPGGEGSDEPLTPVGPNWVGDGGRQSSTNSAGSQSSLLPTPESLPSGYPGKALCWRPRACCCSGGCQGRLSKANRTHWPEGSPVGVRVEG